MRAYRSFADVNEQLDRVDWHDLEQPANVLADVGPERLLRLYEPVLARALGEMAERGSSEILHPKSTHAKFYVAGERPSVRGGHTLWVHDYRFSGNNSLLEPGELIYDLSGKPAQYVERWHTHRHDFVSLHGGGEGYTEDRVSPADTREARMNARGFWTPHVEEWNPVTRRYNYGDIMTIRGPYDIHRVYDAGAAITFLAQGPNQNGYSQAYADGGMVIGEYPDLATHIEESLAAYKQDS